MDKKSAYVLKNYLNGLKKKEITSYSEIPEEYHDNQEVMRITRRLGLRKITKCGYDIISNSFFVEETIVVANYAQELIDRKIIHTFADFKTYFEFLQGEIYNNSYYFNYMMNCGLRATVIEDFGCKDITVQFEDGLIRKHRRRDHFDLGKIAHVPDKSE